VRPIHVRYRELRFFELVFVSYLDDPSPSLFLILSITFLFLVQDITLGHSVAMSVFDCVISLSIADFIPRFFFPGLLSGSNRLDAGLGRLGHLKPVPVAMKSV